MPQAIVVYTQTAAIVSLLLLIINTGIKFGKASACPADSRDIGHIKMRFC